MSFTIDNFWRSRLSGSSLGESAILRGWKHVKENLSTFLEAPLNLSQGYGGADPNTSNVILVSAPGAVGKTTLARHIAYRTKAMLLDLAEADPVGANTLVGGLARTSLYGPFQEGKVALIIDGLDEARMRVGEDSFAAFMLDVVTLAKENTKPLVLFGRTGAIQEAWIWLDENGIEAPVLEIGYYDQEQATKFVKMQVQKMRKEDDKREPDSRAIDLLLNQLRTQAGSDGNAFSGYSPVLIAVAKEVTEAPNTQELISHIEKGGEQNTLTTIVNAILLREQEKIKNLAFDDETLHQRLYTPEEQLMRLVSHIYGTPLPSLPSMSMSDQSMYENALHSWMSDHPFLDGEKPSLSVFDGMISSKALCSKTSNEVALQRELGRGMKTNPFIAKFYISELSQRMDSQLTNGVLRIPANHIGIIYASLRARLALNETINLHIDGEDVEISRHNQMGESIESLFFITEQNGHFYFGSQVEDIDISSPDAQIFIGHESEITFFAPVFIDVHKVSFDANRIVATIRSGHKNTEQNSVIYIQANQLSTPHDFSHPVLRNADLKISSPDANIFPWFNFAIMAPPPLDHRLEEALRRLKKILRLFRAYGRGGLAKYSEAIEHRRRTQGLGQSVLEQLLSEEILYRDGRMYFLDPDKLAHITGLTFHDVRTTDYSDLTIDFLNRAIE